MNFPYISISIYKQPVVVKSESTKMNSRAASFFIVFFLGASMTALAQVDTLQIEKKPLKIRGYIGGVYENAPVAPDHTNSFGIQAAVIMKNHIEIGFYNLIYNDNKYQERLIFPNSFQMNYKHAGFVLGYRTNLERDYEFNFESKVGFGEVIWSHSETGEAFLSDKFRVLQLQVSVDYILAKFLAVNAFAGYRWMNQLEITGLSNDDFNGLSFGLVMKVGKFR
ncbi:MAG: hypothetical protein ABJQ37_10645 [Reichenbachiella sp.]|uniref:hypothetical protein n=2 Tax=Reichenbachiella sp. TaxID=2184521 RepID=UPI0032978437